MKTLRNAKGFTLIELIIIIIILGILSAVAIPKYIDMKSEAQKATKLGITGALNSTESIMYAANKMSSSNPAPSAAAVYANTTLTGVDSLAQSGETITGKIGGDSVTWTRSTGDPASWSNN